MGKASMYDTSVPQSLVIGVYLPGAARVSSILRPLDLPLSFNQPTEQLVVTNDFGQIRNAAITGGIHNDGAGPDGDCGYAVDVGEVTDIPMSGELFSLDWGVELTYFTGDDATVLVRIDDDVQEVALPAPDPGEIATRQLVLSGEVSEFSVEGVEGESSVCVTGVRVGNVEPSDEVPEALRD